MGSQTERTKLPPLTSHPHTVAEWLVTPQFCVVQVKKILPFEGTFTVPGDDATDVAVSPKEELEALLDGSCGRMAGRRQ